MRIWSALPIAGSRVRITSVRIRIQLFNKMRFLIQFFTWIRILLLNVIWFAKLRPLVWRPYRGSILSLRASICIHDPPRLRFEPLKLLNFYFNSDLDPAFLCNTNPDAASNINADPCGSGSAPWTIGTEINPECTFLYLSPFPSAISECPPSLRLTPLLRLPRYLHFHHHLSYPSVSLRTKII